MFITGIQNTSLGISFQQVPVPVATWSVLTPPLYLYIVVMVEQQANERNPHVRGCQYYQHKLAAPKVGHNEHLIPSPSRGDE